MTREEIFKRFEMIGVTIADQFQPKDEPKIVKRIFDDKDFELIVETDPVQQFDFDTAEELGPHAIAYSEDGGVTWIWRPAPEYHPEAHYRFYYKISPELAWEWLQYNKATPRLERI